MGDQGARANGMMRGRGRASVILSDRKATAVPAGSAVPYS